MTFDESYIVTNIVCSCDVELLQPISRMTVGTYSPAKFPSRIIKQRLMNRNLCMNLSKNGYASIMGMTCELEVDLAHMFFEDHLSTSISQPRILTISSKYKLPKSSIPLQKFAQKLIDAGVKIDYNPELISCIFYKLTDPKTCFSIFAKGTVVCVGGRNLVDFQHLCKKTYILFCDHLE